MAAHGPWDATQPTTDWAYSPIPMPERAEIAQPCLNLRRREKGSDDKRKIFTHSFPTATHNNFSTHEK
jgi:hypothetical protein